MSKTDTLDAIAREITDQLVAVAMTAQEEYWNDPAHHVACKLCTQSGVYSCDWCPDCGGVGTICSATEAGSMRAALSAALTALSNQGEGAVVMTGWTKADGKTRWMCHDGLPVFNEGKHGDLGTNKAIHLYEKPSAEVGRDSYKHGWINSALWAGRNDLISDIDSQAYIKARDEVLGKLATEAEADRRDADHD